MKTAFTYMFKDNMLLKKALPALGLGLGQTLCPLISGGFTEYADKIMETNPSTALVMSLLGLFLSIIGIICAFVYWGYVVTCIKSIVTQKENIVLPFVSFKKNIKLGLKYTIASLLYTTCLIGLAIPPFILIMIPATKIIGTILTIITMLFILAVVTTCSMGLLRIFAHTEDITSFIQFKRLFSLIAKDKARYFKALGLCMGLGVAIMVLIAIPIIGMIAFGLLIPYTTFVVTYLIANSISTEQFETV